MRLLSAERMFAFIIAAIAIVDLVLILLKGVSMDWAGYSVPFFGSMLLIAGGQYYSIHRGEKRLALALTASGLFIIFTLVASVFNYLLLPIRSAPLDLIFVRIDALFGYSWPNAVNIAARWPVVTKVLFFVYFSSLPQLVFVVLLLSFLGKEYDLWHFLLTGVLGVMGCIAIWAIFPTFGPSTLYAISPEILSKIDLGVTHEYGAELLQLGRNGPGYLSPSHVLGLIGFPSFHTVMACMSVVFLLRFKLAATFALLLNAAMIPAILVHGGHHLSDLFGGVAMFALAYAVAGRLGRYLASSGREVPFFPSAPE